MAVEVTKTDVIMTVYRLSSNRVVGQNSPYVNTPHPASGKKIHGWQWDRRVWPSENDFKGAAYVPSLWDPTISGLSDSYFQSGYGDNEDIELLNVDEIIGSGSTVWAPRIHHGYYYIYDQEWYLFSDDYQTQFFTSSGISGGQQYIDMRYAPKPTIPIQVRRFEWNRLLGRTEVDIDWRKRITMTNSGVDGPQFTLDEAYSPPRVWLNGDFTEEIGLELTLDISGFLADPTDIFDLEQVGITKGESLEEHHLRYSPVDTTSPVDVWVFQSASEPVLYEVVSGVDLIVSGHQVALDYNTGVLTFGPGALRVLRGRRIAARYSKGAALFYEPTWGRDYLVSSKANINPVAASTYQGFVQILTTLSDPYSVELETNLAGSATTGYEIDVGNSVGRIIATVRNRDGEVLEGETVYFEFVSREVGSFEGESSVSRITGANGVAAATFNAPATVVDAGVATIDVSWSSGNTVITAAGLYPPTSVSGLYLYRVNRVDEFLGVPDNDAYYEAYFTEQEIIDTTTRTETWEENYRDQHSLPKIAEWDPTDLKDGKKTIVLTSARADVVNPHTGELEPSAPYPFGPLYPDTITNIGNLAYPELEVTYSGLTLELPDTGDTRAYLLVGEGQVYLRAYVINQRTGLRVESPPLLVRITIPDTMNGTYYASVLNSVPSGLMTAVTDITLLTDEQILTTTGQFWDSYLEERLFERPRHIMRYAYQRKSSGGKDEVLYFTLYDTDDDVIAEWTETIDNDLLNTGEYRLTEQEAEKLSGTDYNAMSLQITTTTSGSDSESILWWLRFYIDRTSTLAKQEVYPEYVVSGTWEEYVPFDNDSADDENYPVTGFEDGQTPQPDISFETITVQPNQLLVATFGLRQSDAVPSIESMTDTLGLTWKLEALSSVLDAGPYASEKMASEIWWATTSGLADTATTSIVATCSSGVDSAVGMVAAYNDMDMGNPVMNGASAYGDGTETPETGVVLTNQGRYLLVGSYAADAISQDPSSLTFSDSTVARQAAGSTHKVAYANQYKDYYGLPAVQPHAVDMLSSALTTSGYSTWTGAGVAFRMAVPLEYDMEKTLDESTADTTAGIISHTDGLGDASTTKLYFGSITDPETIEDYSTWFRRTRMGDTVGMEGTALAMQDVLSGEGGSGEIPIGFRIRSNGITIASVVDQITYIDPNDHLPSGYFDS